MRGKVHLSPLVLGCGCQCALCRSPAWPRQIMGSYREPKSQGGLAQGELYLIMIRVDISRLPEKGDFFCLLPPTFLSFHPRIFIGHP